MPKPQFHGTRTTFSASKALDTIGRTVISIRENDHLTWKDVGRVFGKSEDRAASYATGMSEMGVTSFLLGCREWGGHFANPALEQIGMKLVPLDAREVSDHEIVTTLIRTVLALQEAREDDNIIDDAELAACLPQLEKARKAIDALCIRARPRVVDIS